MYLCLPSLHVQREIRGRVGMVGKRGMERGSRWILFSSFQLLLRGTVADAFLMIFMVFFFPGFGGLIPFETYCFHHALPPFLLPSRVSPTLPLLRLSQWWRVDSSAVDGEWGSVYCTGR